MTASADETTTVHYCVVCGPCLRLLHGDDEYTTVHKNIPHPDSMTFDEEENPQ